MIRVLVGISSAVIRTGLEAILAREPSILVVGGDHQGDGLVDEIAEHEPDVVLVEGSSMIDAPISVPGDGFELGARAPAIVALVDERDAPHHVDLFRRGARGLIPHGAGVAEILAAVASAAAGLVSLPADWLPPLLPPNGAAAIGTSAPLSSRDSPALSPREREVLRMISEGLANKQIAARLGISDHTVKFHVSSVFAKLQASSRAEAVMIGARQGLIVL